ncbi:hypothetical protein GUJ93_ZPchr0008g11443 [Zizania palustris]|uniref:Uncharacterized protein n=1 Tax=Zizania palustris TaxID=103762 RepID=A0A8J5R7A5_ZIZPA|nr:hypothetical protein GUJ93_ZPchr0008g11443 [Zizania palustris]
MRSGWRRRPQGAGAADEAGNRVAGRWPRLGLLCRWHRSGGGSRQNFLLNSSCRLQQHQLISQPLPRALDQAAPDVER